MVPLFTLSTSRSSLLLAAVALAPLAPLACTATVLTDDRKDAPCASDDDCPATAICVDDGCAPQAQESIGAAFVVGATGGRILGVDGVFVDVNAGSVDGSRAFSITRASGTLPHNNFSARSRFYQLVPEGDVDGVVTVPVEGGCDGCALFVRPADGSPQWTRVAIDDEGRAALARAAVFAVGVDDDSVDDDEDGDGDEGGAP